MTDTDIVTRLAREAGAHYMLGPGDEPTDGYLAFEDKSHVGPPDYPSLRRFAALVAEECAKVCDERIGYWQRDDIRRYEDEHCATAIRAKFKA